MLFTFAWQGYAAFSIAFSTLHIILSYVFILFVIKDLKKIQNPALSLKFIYAGLFFLFLSSFGPWGLVFVVVSGLAQTDLYKQAIYFYLHFQYNGWFIFTLTGLWLSHIEKSGINLNKKHFSAAFNILFYSCIAAYTLSLLGFNISRIIWFIAFLSAVIQLFGAKALYKMLFAGEPVIFSSGNKWTQRLFRFSFLALFLKFILQLVSSIPEIGVPGFISREVIIGYLHLVMIGVVTVGLFGWLSANKLLNTADKYVKAGILVLITAFLISELILFYPAIVIWFRMQGIPHFSEYLFVLNIFMMAGTVSVFYGNLRKQN